MEFLIEPLAPSVLMADPKDKQCPWIFCGEFCLGGYN
jgi:hypothetical protein